MELGRFRRSVLGLIFFVSAAGPAETAAVATDTPTSPAIQYADTADCLGKQPSGLIFYITVPDDPTTEPRELVVSDPSGKIVRTFDVRNPWWLYPSNQPGKAFVYTFDFYLYLVDATTGEVNFVFDERGTDGIWPTAYDERVTPDHDWQVIYGASNREDDLVVNLNTGAAQPITDWMGASEVDDYRYSTIAPDGKHIVIYFDTGYLKVGEAGNPNTLKAISKTAAYEWFYSLDGESIIYKSYDNEGQTILTAARLSDLQQRVLVRTFSSFVTYPIRTSNDAIVVIVLSDGRYQLTKIDLGSGKDLSSTTVVGYPTYLYVYDDPKQALLWGSDENGGFLGYLDTETGTSQNLSHLNGYSIKASWPTPRWLLAYSGDSESLWTSGEPTFGIDLSTGGVHQLPNTFGESAKKYTIQQVSDDGRFYLSVAELATGANGFVVWDLGGDPPRLLSKGEHYGAVFSPDDCWIAYSEYQKYEDNLDPGIFITRTDGDGGVTKIGEGMHPVWVLN